MSETEPTPEASQFNLGTVIDDAKRVITNPVEFYRNMPTSGGYANPLIFVVAMAAISGILIAVLSMIGLGRSTMGGTMAVGIGAVIMMPIMATIGSFIGAAILFVIWKLMGSDKEYEAAYRSVAYSFAIWPIAMILSIVPYIGSIIQTLWSMFLGYTSSVEVGKVKEQTAKIVFGVLAALMVVGGINAERTANKMEARMSSTFKNLEDMEDMSAEEAGRKLGEFMNGLQEAAEEAEAKNKEKSND